MMPRNPCRGMRRIGIEFLLGIVLAIVANGCSYLIVHWM